MSMNASDQTMCTYNQTMWIKCAFFLSLMARCELWSWQNIFYRQYVNQANDRFEIERMHFSNLFSAWIPFTLLATRIDR